MSKRFIIPALFLVGFCGVLWLSNSPDLANQITIYGYYLVAVGVIVSIIDFYREL